MKKAFPRTGFHSLAFRFPPTVVRCLLHGHQAALPVVARGSSGRQGLLLPGDHRTSRGQSQVRFAPSLEAVSVLFYYLNRGVAIALTKRPELAGCLDNLELVVISWFLFFTPLLHDTAVGRSARERARIRRPLRPRPRGRLPGTKGKHCALRR